MTVTPTRRWGGQDLNLRIFCIQGSCRNLLGRRPAVARVSIELTTSALWARCSGQLSYLAMVGHRGIEPRDTCVSGRPVDQLGRGQRRGRESNSQGRSSAAFGADPVADRVASPRGWWTDRTSASRDDPTSGFQPGTFPLGQPSMLRKAGDLNAAGLTAHRLAGEPGTPVRFTFRSAPRTRTEITQGLDLLALPLA